MSFYEREEMQRIAREETERFRVRVLLPQAAFVSRPVRGFSGPINRGVNRSAMEQIRSNPYASFGLKLLCVILGLVVWVQIARKLAPELAESVTGWLPALALPPAESADRLVVLLAEEKAVSEFQAALSTGARASGAEESVAVPATGGSLFSPAAGYIRKIQKLLQEARRSVVPAEQRGFLFDALNEIRPLKNLAKSDELLPLWQVTCAVEMLLQQLTEKAGNVTSSTLRTAALAVTMLEELCQPGLKRDLFSEPPLRLLVVDDETFSRYALAHSLKRGLSEPDVAESGESALKLAAERAYDLIFLDVQLPGMDGFELCSKIHETLANRATPVVFVTSMRDFDARANSILCGGRDLIAKPFLTFELTVKALTLVATERLRGRARLTDATVEEVKAVESAAPLPEAAKAPVEVVVEDQPVAGPAPALNRARRVRTMVPVEETEWSLSETAGEFFVQARVQMDVLRELAQMIRNMPTKSVQQEMITELVLGIHLLAKSAEASGQHSINLVAAALEGLLRKLLENAANLSASTLDTMVVAADLIQDLCVEESNPDLATRPPIRVLAVDDDPVSLRAMGNALQMRFAKPDSASDGKSALALASERPFDVIFLDVQMPDLDGFEVCARIRETEANRDTPVVFVTSHQAAELRAKSELCGGDDFLTKPYLSSELNLKALAFALRGRMQNAGEAVLECAS
jgi:PleD family two-component response regulator